MTAMAQKVLDKSALNPIPSSSPAFGTPVHPIRPRNNAPIPPPQLKPATILPVQLQPALLRKTAVRVFKNHDLNLESSALTALSTFIGKHCGSGWREDGLAEGVLTEVAKLWKKEAGDAIVKGGDLLKNILKTLEGSMIGGRVTPKTGLSRQTSFALSERSSQSQVLPQKPPLESQNSFGLSSLEVTDDLEDEDVLKDPREWIEVIGAFDQPRLIFNPTKKHFEKNPTKPSLLPPPAHKTELFRQRYHLVQQRVLRHESFQSPAFMGTGLSSSDSGYNKIMPIANLLGRSGSAHLLLGLITVSPTGTLALSDQTGSIALDLQHARPFPDESSVIFAPGMIVLVDGVYQEDYSHATESALGNTGGIGGTIGGKFIGSVVAHPPCERRAASLGIQETAGVELPTLTGPAFGWTDFLGVGSERATGSRMRKLQERIIGTHAPHTGNAKIVIASEVNLDKPATLSALRAMLTTYAALPMAEFPMTVVLIGNFISQAAMAGAPGAGSIDYKEHFNSLASLLLDFPALIARTTLVFVPGDKDAWSSAFSAGSATALPQRAIPEIFTSRIRRAVAEANREVGGGKERKEGEAIWTSNPSRLTWFGCEGEMVLFRDDLSGRLRRSAIRFTKQNEDNEEDHEMSGAIQNDTAASTEGETQSDAMEVESAATNGEDGVTDPDISAARQLTKTVLDQAHLAPFPISSRPVQWDYGSVLRLYPLPTALVLADAEAPAFSLNYMGCCVMNPGTILDGRRSEKARWVEYDVIKRKGEIKVVNS